jgi:hypothetical protein
MAKIVDYDSGWDAWQNIMWKVYDWASLFGPLYFCFVWLLYDPIVSGFEFDLCGKQLGACCSQSLHDIHIERYECLVRCRWPPCYNFGTGFGQLSIDFVIRDQWRSVVGVVFFHNHRFTCDGLLTITVVTDVTGGHGAVSVVTVVTAWPQFVSAHTKETGNRNATAISKKSRRFQAGNWFPNY